MLHGVYPLARGGVLYIRLRYSVNIWAENQEAAIVEGAQLIEAIHHANKAGVCIPERAERAFGVAMVLETPAKSGYETRQERISNVSLGESESLANIGILTALCQIIFFVALAMMLRYSKICPMGDKLTRCRK